MWRWAASHSGNGRAALTTVLQVLHLLGRIPAIEPLLPLPGSYRQLSAVAEEVDEKMLARVRALLAKAEATEYPDEAEALSAKAQALMVRHSLKRRSPITPVAGHPLQRVAGFGSTIRMWVQRWRLCRPSPQANRCRAIWVKDLGCVVTVGAESDLDLVDLLATSLLVQASRAMLSAGRRHDVRGQSRTKSFRLSFLVAYAARIGERLAAASSSVTEELRRDDRLLPVLVARNRAADETFNRLFPRTVASPLTGYDSVGLGAGRCAADTAMLDVRDSIAG